MDRRPETNVTANRTMEKYLSLLIIIPMIAGCSSDCTNRLIQTFPSPDSSLTAFVYERNCGATTGFNRQVVVMKSGKKFPPHAGPDSFFAIDGSPKVQIEWKTAGEIAVKYELGYEVIRAETNSEYVRINYESIVIPIIRNQ